jgi:transcription elongation factor GreB
MTVKNYITPFGAEKLKAELRHLRDTDRPAVVKVVAWAASNGDRSENADYYYGKRRLREIDQRIEFLTDRLSRIEIVDPVKHSGTKIFFGATVSVEDPEGTVRRYAIVGADETDSTKNRISWLSPVGKALLSRNLGDVVNVPTPGGDQEFEIVKVEYLAID